MNAAEILVAVQEAGATLRVEGDSLVASNASRLAPDLKAAIRENKSHLLTALVGSGCKVTIVEIPATGLRYRRTYAHLQLRPPAHIPEDRWRMAVSDGRGPSCTDGASKPKRSAGLLRTYSSCISRPQSRIRLTAD
jgi:hypothetical protein